MTAFQPIRCALTADQSAAILAAKIRAQEPFFFVRYGDGALECMAGRKGSTCDHEQYSPELGAELVSCWRALMKRPELVYVGDWQSASFEKHDQGSRYAEQYEAMFEGAELTRLHFEALLLMRESAELVDFYRAVKEDPRRKLFMGPSWNAGAAKMLGAGHLITPMTSDLLAYFRTARISLSDLKFDILLYGAGMAGNIPAIRCWEKYPDRTYVNLGSAMDPLFHGQTRRQQLDMAAATKLFRET